MKKQTRLTFVSTVILSLFASTSIARDSDELRERAKALQKEAAVFAERGQEARATEWKKKAEELLHRAEKESNSKNENHKKGDDILRLSAKFESLRETYHKMQSDGASENELHRVEKELRATAEKLESLKKGGRANQNMPPEMQPQMEKIERAWKQVGHIRQAAEHLKMAELHDMAHELMKRAEDMEREIRMAKERMAAEETEKRVRKMQGKEKPPMQDHVQEMRAELERLRDEVEALKAQLKKD